MSPLTSKQEKSGPTPRRRRRRLISKKLLIIWLVILVLECTTVASISAFWVLTPGRGIAPPPAVALLSWPEPTLPVEPTPTPTQVVIYLPTTTDTPSPTPTSTDTPTPPATNLPIATAIPTQTAAPTQTQIQHVVIISIDGLRPDALELADTPALDSLKAHGAYSPNAQTVSLSITLPSHASMLSGMTPDKHGILWGVPYIGWPGMNGPTLFNVAHDAGLSTAMVFGKQKMNYLALPNSVDQLFGADVHDTEVKKQTVALIQAGLPNVLFIHFPDVDRVGHAAGWMSPNQLHSITFVDGLIGEIVTALENGDYLNRTLLIITADHGGHDRSHGDDSPEDRTIPWLAVGPGVRAGVILTGSIITYDTAATALYALNLPMPEVWDGKPVLEIFN